MGDESNRKHPRAGAKAMPQYEADAEAIREKTARLKALRLAHEAANMSATGAASGGRRAASKKKPDKSVEKPKSLSEWLSTQQKEGRRN